MNLKRILFPTDFSHYNDAALGYASTLAAETNAILYIVHVDDRADLSAAIGDPAVLYPVVLDKEDRREVRDQLSKVLPTVAGTTYEHHYLRGSAVAEILRFVDREHADLIVMASHGRSGLSRLLMGSVAEGVLRKARCPVLVVKQPVTEQSAAMDVPAGNAELHIVSG